MDLFIGPDAGIWCRSIAGWDGFRAALQEGTEPNARYPGPIPDLLPEREGRRAPLHVRLALEAAAQACHNNFVAAEDVLTVFASSMGDSEITDYMCRTLAGPAPMLSPTRFHNSVHNAASGYWSIGATNRHASVAIAASPHTFTAALLEAASLAITEAATVLLIVHDVPAPPPVDAISGNRQPFSAAFLLAPGAVTPQWRQVRLECRQAAVEWPEPSTAWLRELAAENECARALPLLEALASKEKASLRWPLAEAAALDLRLGNG
ncbi:MAG: beta-ketoacyl synthase chain length factor [Gammaproteobacteria bacterium]